MNIIQSVGKIFSSKEKVSNLIEKKDTEAGGYNPLMTPFWGSNGERPILYTSEAVLYMMECAPVWTALHKISKGCASIPPKVMNIRTGEYVDHPVLKLLSRPDADITFSEFMEQACEWFLGTGNTYIRALGYVKKPPQSMRIMPSYATTVQAAGDGYADIIITRLLSIADVYNRQELVEFDRPRFRYYANEFNEIYQIRTFNPQVGSNMVYGLSPLNAVLYEMRQYIEAAKSNLSTLNRSSRLSGVWSYEGMLNDQQRALIEQQINTALAGANNAGRNILLDKKTTFVDLMKSVRDMDYVNTSKHTAEVIYKALDIPLPIVNAENMTYANYESAQYYLFKDAVIPLTQRIYQELTSFLMPRYGTDEFIITFNPKDIPQLEPERNIQMKMKKDTGITTLNELRQEVELDPIDGGQHVYSTAGATPIATDENDEFAGDDSAFPSSVIPPEPKEAVKPGAEAESDNSEENAEKQKSETLATRDQFISKMRLQVNRDGTSRFTENEINELATEHFGAAI